MTNHHSARARQSSGFLARLRRDTRGNTFAIVGAAMVPLTALIGGGVDMSRGYMARERLQQACDAAALAGRRAMTNGTVDATVIDEAKKFFKFNFATGTDQVAETAAFGAKGFVPTVAAAPDNATTVVVTASTTIPTTMMSLFGFTTLPLDVSCDAKQDFVNTDIVLVLDVTGSMACLPSDSATTCSTWVNNNPTQVGVANVRSTSRMAALREAVLALYNQLKPIQDKLYAPAVNMRLRYAVVPYSSSINVGQAVYAANPDYMARDTWTYQSRTRTPTGEFASTTTVNGTYSNPDTNWAAPGTTFSPWIQHTYNSAYVTKAQCEATKPGNSAGANGTEAAQTSASVSTDEDGVVTTKYNQNRPHTRTEYQAVWGKKMSNGKGDCLIEKRTATQTISRTNTETKVPKYKWVYGARSFDVSNFIAGNAVATKTGDADTTTGPAKVVTSTWLGCIEERQTDKTLGGTSGAIPTAAHDLNVDMVPTIDKTTKWKPYWPEVEYYRTSTTDETKGAKPQVACPAPAKRMQKWDTAETLSGYLNTLAPTGGTYHDNGMIWGARFISSGGIFGGDNPTSYNGMPVTKHMIFMTDGFLDTGLTLYSTYGIEAWDNRVGSTSEDDQTARHKQRFRLMCSRVKSMNVSLWVVAFASGLDDDLKNCASSVNQASTSANKTTLINKFTEIGKNIGALRLTQ